ncbi:MAG TPA: ATP-binding protein [Gemmatimonadales bacterium]
MTSLRLCVRRSEVLEPDGPATAVTLRLPSDVECIEEAVALLTYHCTAGATASERLRFRLQVVLAEALANAILRGNSSDADKHVEVRVVLRPAEMRLHVTDEGPGFDPGAVPEPLGADAVHEPNGRGLFLIRHLSDAVSFTPRGNSICITLRRR